MDPWLQEETLDEIERLTREPGVLVPRGIRPGLVYDFTRLRDGVTHYVFLIVEVDESSRHISLRQLGHVSH